MHASAAARSTESSSPILVAETIAPPRVGIAALQWLARPGFAGAIARSVVAALFGGIVNLCLTHWGGTGLTFALIARVIPHSAFHLTMLGLLLVALVAVSILAIPAREDSNGNDSDA